MMDPSGDFPRERSSVENDCGKRTFSEICPEPEEGSFIQFARRLPLRWDADVVVAGGGIAGVSAAIAAAKRGMKVLLIERFGVPGGNATSGGVSAFCGETRGQGEVFDEMIAELERFKAIAPYEPYERLEARIFNHEIFAFILQEMLLRHGVKVLLHACVAGCVVEGSKILQCVVAGPSGLEAASGKMFIDCSGEATLARAAGFSTMKGRAGDHLQLPMALMFFVRHTLPGDEAPKVPSAYLEREEGEPECPAMSVWPNGPRSNAIKVKVPFGDSTDSESLSAAEMKARRRMMRILDFQTREKGRPWMLDHCSPVIGVREGRRALGEYVLRADDLRAGRRFDDAVARGVFYFDCPSAKEEPGFALPKECLKVPPYQMPFRSLVVKDASNLLVAGRCFSGDQLALSSARVMTTCSMMGQAAGIGAALAAKGRGAIQDVDYLEVGKEARAHGAILD